MPPSSISPCMPRRATKQQEIGPAKQHWRRRRYIPPQIMHTFSPSLGSRLLPIEDVRMHTRHHTLHEQPPGRRTTIIDFPSEAQTKVGHQTSQSRPDKPSFQPPPSDRTSASSTLLRRAIGRRSPLLCPIERELKLISTTQIPDSWVEPTCIFARRATPSVLGSLSGLPA